LKVIGKLQNHVNGICETANIYMRIGAFQKRFVIKPPYVALLYFKYISYVNCFNQNSTFF